MIHVLDRGYVDHIETWGSDERIIEAARMSTAKGFTQWEDCWECPLGHTPVNIGAGASCEICDMPLRRLPGDANLLRYLYTNKHMTPFEMAGIVIEVKAPIFVFREWHRHRTQSYNEMSARYVPLPNEDYMPDFNNIMTRTMQARSGNNKQAFTAADVSLTQDNLKAWLSQLDDIYRVAQGAYAEGLAIGVPKELARLCVPVARYSRMRASANLRNWLAFLTLRTDEHAQWEIRQYANAVGQVIAGQFPRTWELFKGERT